MRAPSTRTWAVVIIALAVVLMVGLQIVASVARFPGPLGSLLNDYVGTPKSATVPWVGLGVAMVGVPTRWRISALATAVAVDALFTIERLLHTGIFAVGSGPMIVLTGLTLVVWWRWNGAQRATALHGIALGFLLIVATKIADTWLDVTAIARPRVRRRRPGRGRGVALSVHRVAVSGGGGRGLPVAQRHHRWVAAALPGADVLATRPERAGDLRGVPARRPELRVRHLGWEPRIGVVLAARTAAPRHVARAARLRPHDTPQLHAVDAHRVGAGGVHPLEARTSVAAVGRRVLAGGHTGCDARLRLPLRRRPRCGRGVVCGGGVGTARAGGGPRPAAGAVGGRGSGVVHRPAGVLPVSGSRNGSAPMAFRAVHHRVAGGLLRRVPRGVLRSQPDHDS